MKAICGEYTRKDVWKSFSLCYPQMFKRAFQHSFQLACRSLGYRFHVSIHCKRERKQKARKVPPHGKHGLARRQRHEMFHASPPLHFLPCSTLRCHWPSAELLWHRGVPGRSSGTACTREKEKLRGNSAGVAVEIMVYGGKISPSRPKSPGPHRSGQEVTGVGSPCCFFFVKPIGSTRGKSPFTLFFFLVLHLPLI